MPESAQRTRIAADEKAVAALVAERSALDVVLRCFVGEVGATSGMVVGRGPDLDVRALAIWGVDGAQPRASWARGSFLGETFEAPYARIAPRRFDPPGLPELNGAADEGLAGKGSLAAPITTSGGRLGAIYAEFSDRPMMDPDELLWLADSYAQLAALCMRGGQGLAAALTDSRRDRLTGCLNHDGVVDVLRTEVARAQRERHRLSCCFVDLDGFKAINDLHGHLAGNRVLAATGESLRTGLRPYDAVGRFGGDEFVVVLPYADAAAATQMVHRIRLRIGAQVVASTGFPIFVSAGVAEWRREDSAFDLLDAADQALIDAKHAGRARVATARGQSGRLAGMARSLLRGGTGHRPSSASEGA